MLPRTGWTDVRETIAMPEAAPEEGNIPVETTEECMAVEQSWARRMESMKAPTALHLKCRGRPRYFIKSMGGARYFIKSIGGAPVLHRKYGRRP